jgi:hypothetical protein
MAVENDSTGLSPPHLMEVEFGEQGPLGIEFAWPFVAGVKQGSAAELAGLGFGMRVVSIAGAECAADMPFDAAEQQLHAAGRPLRLALVRPAPAAATGRAGGHRGDSDDACGGWREVVQRWQASDYPVSAAPEELAIQHVWAARRGGGEGGGGGGGGEWVKALVWVRQSPQLFRAGSMRSCYQLLLAEPPPSTALGAGGLAGAPGGRGGAELEWWPRIAKAYTLGQPPAGAPRIVRPTLHDLA